MTVGSKGSQWKAGEEQGLLSQLTLQISYCFYPSPSVPQAWPAPTLLLQLLYAEPSAAASGMIERPGDCLPRSHSSFAFPFPFSLGPVARYKNNSAPSLHRASHPGNLKAQNQPAKLIALIFLVEESVFSGREVDCQRLS